MRILFLISLSLAGTAIAATPATSIAVKCTGTLAIIPEGSRAPETRVYVIDDAKQMVYLWSATAQAKVPICLIECAKNFGANQIRLIEGGGASEMMLDIQRDSGEIMHFLRSSSPARMATFKGSCEKTLMPRITGAKKF